MMIGMLSYVGVMGVLIGLLAFISNRKHLLSMLLSLEYIALSLYYLLCVSINLYIEEDYVTLYFLTMVVCEGVLGLGIMVMVVRSVGNDYFFSFNLLKC